MKEVVLLATACMLGFVHALEVDHMLAVTTYVSRNPAITAAARFGARWGIGHSIAVLAAGGVLLAFGVRWPAHWDAAGEAAVGGMLVVLGVWAILSARRLTHQAVSDARPTAHAHRGVTLVGFLHGLAGTSAAVALVPITMLDRTAAGLGYLAAFGLGVTVAMTLFAMVAAVAMRRAADRSRLWSRRAATGVGAAAILTGVVWMLRAASA